MLWMLQEAKENSANSIASLKGKPGRFSVSGYYFYISKIASIRRKNLKVGKSHGIVYINGWQH